MIIDLLGRVARYGRLCLVLGLLAGLILPGVAAVMRPWIPELVSLLLFFTAFRVGYRDATGVDLSKAFGQVLILQLALPVGAVLMLIGLDLGLGPLAMAVVLVLAAPSVTGAPNFTILVGGDPARALRVLVLGTALLPVTALPVFWLLPQIGDLQDVLWAAGRLTLVVLSAVALGFAVRQLAAPDLGDRGRAGLDGLTSIVLAVIVVALMSAIGPAFSESPLGLFWWLSVAFAVNFGMQVAYFTLLTVLGQDRNAIPMGIVAGNRNVALFLVALPPETTEPLLIFIGCYQIPMYLTPILLRRFYARALCSD
ncbi:hypothetical protein QEZ52_18940 [Aliisedimentitalea scapharcae]|uniref:Bile acid:Na+ symporter, BASS family n=1 Tax=Aliisedimentitalea scapharcae TaxID=1524259 RepID=A0ABZ2XUX8_9RHOB